MIVATLLAKVIGTANDRELKKIRPFVAEINANESAVQGLSDEQLRGKTAEFKQRLAQGAALDDLIPEAFAVVSSVHAPDALRCHTPVPPKSPTSVSPPFATARCSACSVVSRVHAPDALNRHIPEASFRAFILAGQGRRKDREAAVRILEDISKLQPLAANDQFVLAQLYQSLNDKVKSRTLLRTVLGREGDNTRYVAYFVRVLLADKEPDEAKTWVAHLEKLQPKAGRTVELKP